MLILQAHNEMQSHRPCTRQTHSFNSVLFYSFCEFLADLMSLFINVLFRLMDSHINKKKNITLEKMQQSHSKVICKLSVYIVFKYLLAFIPLAAYLQKLLQMFVPA